MTCSNCKREVPEGSLICPFCGVPIADQSEAHYEPRYVAGAPTGAPNGAPAYGAPTGGEPAGEPGFCPGCGAKLESGTVFCPNCGRKVEAQPAAQPQYAQPQGGAPAWSPAPARPLTPAQGICSMFGTTLTLVAAIVYSVSVLFNLINSIGGSSSTSGAVYDILYELGLSSELGGAVSSISGGYVFGVIVGSIPTICLAVGLWLIWLSASGRIAPHLKATGMNVVKITTTVLLVLICVAAAVVEIALAILAAACASSYYMSELVGVCVLLLLIFAVVFAFLIVYYILAIKTTKALRETLRSGAPYEPRFTGFVGVMCFITAACSFIMAIVGISDGGALSFLGGLCSAAASAIFGVFLFSYRTKVRAMGAPRM